MKFFKKYWWIFVLIILAIILYFVFQSGVQETALVNIPSPSTGGLGGGAIPR